MLEKCADLLLQVFKGSSASKVVNDNTALGVAIVTRIEASVPFLPGSVPDLQFQYLIVDLKGFNFEIDADCALLVIEKPISKSNDQRSFAAVLVSDHHDLVGLRNARSWADAFGVLLNSLSDFCQLWV